MNRALSLILLNALGNLPYIDKKSGVVQVVEKAIATSGGSVLKKFPFSSLATLKGVDQIGKLVDMTPESQFKGILYFEDKGINLGKPSASTNEYISDFRLVVWLNTKIAGTSRGNAMSEIVFKLTAERIPTIDTQVFKMVNVKVSNIPPVTPAIFAEYDYDEAKSQYLIPPFDYFAIDISVSYRIPKGCLTLFT